MPKKTFADRIKNLRQTDLRRLHEFLGLSAQQKKDPDGKADKEKNNKKED